MKVVVLLSGGMDSSTLLYKLLAEGHECVALSVHYGQRHARELNAARSVASGASVTYRELDLRAMRPLLAGSSQTDDDVEVPLGHYEDESMRRTVVPNRNMMLLAAATCWAVSLKYEAVAYAAHAGDHAIYPDCRPVFADAMADAMGLCDYEPIQLLRPLVGVDKGEVARIGLDLGVPFEKTWTCYVGGEKACGQCGSCTERLEAFVSADATDPIEYQ